MIRFLAARVCPMIWIPCLLIPQIAIADLIVLRNGTQHRGVIANREAFRTARGVVEVVSILTDSSATGGATIHRIARGDIEYAVLEDGGDKRQVFDMSLVSLAPGTIDPSRIGYNGPTSRVSAGVGLAIFGAGTAILGATARFGPARLSATPNSVDYDENSYNGFNYALMIGGTALAIGGIAWAVSAEHGVQRISGHVHPSGVILCYRF